MVTIEDFVSHRWEDAKAELKKRDPEFVGKAESEHRLNKLGLYAPQHPLGIEDFSIRRLSKPWHRLLEACFELTMQAEHVETAAVYLTACANRQLAHIEIGKRSSYHLRSWFIHAHTLGERTQSVIQKTAQVYVPDPKSVNKLASLYGKRAYQDIIGPIRSRRNQYAHGKTDQSRSWAKGITEDEGWEGLVAIGMTPQMHRTEFGYPTEANDVLSGKYEHFMDATTEIFGIVGSILHDLEAEIVVPAPT